MLFPICRTVDGQRVTTKAYRLQRLLNLLQSGLYTRRTYANVTSTRLRRQLHEGGQLFTDTIFLSMLTVPHHLDVIFFDHFYVEFHIHINLPCFKSLFGRFSLRVHWFRKFTF